MTTLTHTRGDTLPLVVTLLQKDRTPYDLTDCEVVLQVHTAALCIEIPGTIPDPLLGVSLHDPAPLDALSAGRAFRATVRVTWADGTTETVDQGTAIYIKERC